MSETRSPKIPTRPSLFDKTVQNLKPAKKPYKRSDGGGLYVLVTPDGAYAVTIEVLGPDHVWEDISLRADARLPAGEAMRQYARRLEDQRISTALVQAA